MLTYHEFGALASSREQFHREFLKILIRKMSLKVIISKLLPPLPGAIEFIRHDTISGLKLTLLIWWLLTRADSPQLWQQGSICWSRVLTRFLMWQCTWSIHVCHGPCLKKKKKKRKEEEREKINGAETNCRSGDYRYAWFPPQPPGSLVMWGCGVQNGKKINRVIHVV